MTSLWWLIKVLCGLALVAWAVATALGWTPPVPRVAVPLLVAQVTVIVGALVHVVHYGILKRRAGPLEHPDHLVTDAGLFRFVRHPMYLGDLICYAGLAALAGDAIALSLLAVGTVALVAQARHEDAALRTLFPQTFEAWHVRTRLLLPGP